MRKNDIYKRTMKVIRLMVLVAIMKVMEGGILIYADCTHGIGVPGDGSPGNPFKIANAVQLHHILSHTTTGEHSELTQDITSVDKWVSINDFTNHLDGKGHTIDLECNFSWNYLIYVNRPGAIIENIYFKNIRPVGHNYATLKNITLSSDTSFYTDGNVGGGLTNTNTGLIENCTNNAYVRGVGYSFNVGGITGSNSGTIRNSVNNGAVAGAVTNDLNHKYTNIGGIAGNNWGIIENSYNTSNDIYVTTDQNAHFVGGIVGRHFGGAIRSSYNVGKFTPNRNNTYRAAIVGGMLDGMQSTITNTYHQGDVRGYSIYRKEVYNEQWGYSNDVNTDKHGNFNIRSDAQMKQPLFVSELNSNQSPKPWKKGTGSYPYPILLKGDMNITIASNIPTAIGDNTQYSIKVNLTGEDAIEVASMILADRKSGHILYNGNKTTAINTNSLDNTAELVLQILDSSGGVMGTSNTITYNKVNMLNYILSVTETNNGMSNIIITNETDRYFEDNSINRDIVQRIKQKANGIYLIYNSISPVLAPLLEK